VSVHLLTCLGFGLFMLSAGFWLGAVFGIGLGGKITSQVILKAMDAIEKETKP
jgi:hypothetical protein